MSTAAREPLGIRKIAALVYYVRDLNRVRDFMLGKLDFAEIGESSQELTERGRQQSVVFQAGDVNLVVCAPHGEGGRAWRYLRKHPEGVGTVVFDVENIEHTFRLLDERGGTMISDIERFSDEGGTLAMFSITTPFGDTTFRFVERQGYRSFFPGLVPYDAPRGGQNQFRFKRIDHLTSNFQTMSPALLWMEHVMGMERFWSVKFHTQRRGRRSERWLGPEVGGDDRTAVAHQVRQQRADAPVLQGLADQPLLRGQPGRWRPARRPGGAGHHRDGARAARAGGGVHAHPGRVLRHAAGAAGPPDRRAHRRGPRDSCASWRSWSTARARASTCCRSS